MKARLMHVIRLAMAMWARKPTAVPTPPQEEDEAWGDYSVECDCCRREFVPTPASFVECTVAIDPEWRAEIGTEPTVEQVTLVCQRMNIGRMQAWRVIRRGVLYGVPRAFCLMCRLHAAAGERNRTGGGR